MQTGQRLDGSTVSVSLSFDPGLEIFQRVVYCGFKYHKPGILSGKTAAKDLRSICSHYFAG